MERGDYSMRNLPSLAFLGWRAETSLYSSFVLYYTILHCSDLEFGRRPKVYAIHNDKNVNIVLGRKKGNR